VVNTLPHALRGVFPPHPPPQVPHPSAVRAVGTTHDVDLSDAEVADLQGMVAAFAASDLRARLGAARSVHREHAFAFLLADGPLLNGFVDVIAYEADGSALVVDYKSDQVGDADLGALVEASYATQRQVYALAALRSGAPVVEVAHVFLERPAEPVVARFSQADADVLEGDLRAHAAPLLAGEYPVADVPHRGLCGTCPGRDGLCSYPPELTDRELALR
jgi:ATP-dependent helicase/nuclease subunit A